MTKTTSLPLLSILAAFAVQACAAPAGDDADGSPAPIADDAPATEANDEVSKLAGVFGTPRDARTLANGALVGGQQANADDAVTARLTVVSRKQTYDVLAYGFAIDGTRVSLATGLSASKPRVSDLSIVVAPKAGQPSLSRDVLGGKPIGEVVLSQRDVNGKYVELARLDGATVRTAQADANGDRPTESFTLGMTAMTLEKDSSWVKVDLVKAETSCSDPCPCATKDARLGPYTQASSSLTPIAEDSTRIDSLSVATSNASDKVALDGIAFSSGFDTSGMCAAYYASRGQVVSSVRLGVAAPSSGKTDEARESTTWEACYATVSSVSFGSQWDRTGENVTLDAAGLVRTDRAWSSFDGKLSTTTTGWSFAKGAPIGACSATF